MSRNYVPKFPIISCLIRALKFFERGTKLGQVQWASEWEWGIWFGQIHIMISHLEDQDVMDSHHEGHLTGKNIDEAGYGGHGHQHPNCK